MPTPKEVEIKLELPPASLQRFKKIPLLRGQKGRAKSATEISVYFDTAKHKLHRKGMMLRVRRSGDRYVQTIKSAGNSGSFARDEWESEIKAGAPELRLAQGTALEPLLSGKFRRQLRPIFETRIRRTTYPLSNGKSDIALTLDKGRIATGRSSKALWRFRKIRKKGKKLAELDPRGRHRLRIQAKKVRYASDFFADLFPGRKASKRRKKFLSALERVQDCLGDLNDIAVHEDRITAIANRRGRSRLRGSPKRAFAAGLLTGREDARLDRVLESANDAHSALVRIKPFWR
jgi:inorganic triphosphatase YgiF